MTRASRRATRSSASSAGRNTRSRAADRCGRSTWVSPLSRRTCTCSARPVSPPTSASSTSGSPSRATRSSSRRAAGAVGQIAGQLAKHRGLPNGRDRGRPGESRRPSLALRLRRRDRLQERGRRRSPPRGLPGRSRRVLRQRRRRDLRRSPPPPGARRPNRRSAGRSRPTAPRGPRAGFDPRLLIVFRARMEGSSSATMRTASPRRNRGSPAG